MFVTDNVKHRYCVSHIEISAGGRTGLSVQTPARKAYRVDKPIETSVWNREDELFGNAQNRSCNDISTLAKLA